jgi:hypothetical protein
MFVLNIYDSDERALLEQCYLQCYDLLIEARSADSRVRRTVRYVLNIYDSDERAFSISMIVMRGNCLSSAICSVMTS